jgi:hypothetical protein
MFRFAAVALMLTATAAQAENVGANFCEALQKNYLACGEEAMTTDSNGQFKMECPGTIKSMVSTYDSLKATAKPSERPELDRANDLWRDIAFRIGRRIGESEDQFVQRRNRQIQDIIDQCAKFGVVVN